MSEQQFGIAMLHRPYKKVATEKKIIIKKKREINQEVNDPFSRYAIARMTASAISNTS